MHPRGQMDRHIGSRVKLTERVGFGKRMGGRGGEGRSNAEPVNFSASNDFPAVEVLAELANASKLSLSLSISLSELFNSPPSAFSIRLYLLGRLGGGGIIGRGYYVEAFLKNGRSNIMELP